MATFTSVDEYIKSFPKDIQVKLEELRKIILKVAPAAEQVISYNIPCFKINGKYLIYFAGYKSHIGLYPVRSGTGSLQKELEPYLSGKATVRFATDKPLPADLITRIAEQKLKDLTNT